MMYVPDFVALYESPYIRYLPLNNETIRVANIRVGDGATVGSQAVVTKDVPTGMTVIGLNKLLDPEVTPERKQEVQKRSETWQYEVDAYDGYSI